MAIPARSATSTKPQRALKLFREFMEKQPFAFSHLLEAVDLYLRGPVEVVIVGDRISAEFREWMDRIGLLYVPNLAIYAVDPKNPASDFCPGAGARESSGGRATDRLCMPRANVFDADYVI